MTHLSDHALKPLSNTEIIKLLKKEDYEAVLKHNLLLVYKVATDFRNSKDPIYLDLVQEGCTGLLHACSKYDASHGAQFSSYAALWMKQRMRLLLTREHDIRLPANMHSRVHVVRKLIASLDRDITIADIMEATKTPKSTARIILMASKTGYVEDTKLALKVCSAKDRCPTVAIRESMKLGWHLLTEKEATIVTARFGLDGNTPQTLEEVSHLIRRTRERVRQIQNDALRKLKPYLKECYYD